MKRHAQDFAIIALAVVILSAVEPFASWIADFVLP